MFSFFSLNIQQSHSWAFIQKQKLKFTQKPAYYCHSSFIYNSKKLESTRIFCSSCTVKTAVLHPHWNSTSNQKEVAVGSHGKGTGPVSAKLRISRGHILCAWHLYNVLRQQSWGMYGCGVGFRKGGILYTLQSEDPKILSVVEEGRNISTYLNYMH